MIQTSSWKVAASLNDLWTGNDHKDEGSTEGPSVHFANIRLNAKDDEEEEEEMQIGFPTDVKHVAHIGWDGPSVTSPSWMNDFKPTADGSSNPSSSKGGVKEKSSSSQDIGSSGNGGGSLASDQIPPKPSRRRPSAGASSFDASTQDPPVDVPNIPKQSSRRQKPPGLTISSPARDTSSTDGAIKPSRRHHSQNQNSIDSPKADSPSGPNKHSRRKKSKGSSSGGGSGGGSSKSRTKSSSTATSTELGSTDIKNNNNEAIYDCPSSEMKALDLEEKGYDRINF